MCGHYAMAQAWQRGLPRLHFTEEDQEAPTPSHTTCLWLVCATHLTSSSLWFCHSTMFVCLGQSPYDSSLLTEGARSTGMQHYGFLSFFSL